MQESIFLNGKFIKKEEARISAFSPGLLYGWGLFESMRCYHRKIIYFQQHLGRLKTACCALDIDFTLTKIKGIILEAVKNSGADDAYVRLTIWKTPSGRDILVLAKPYHPYPLKKYNSGFRAYVSRFKQNESSFLARFKTANCLLYRLADLEAKDKGFDEAIILNNRGYLAEGSRSNVFLVKDDTLFTPELECGCLEGITRRVVLDLARKFKLKFYEGKFRPLDLGQAEEAFLTNSLIGIMPLVYLDRQPIAKARPGKLTRFLLGEYNRLLKNATAGNKITL